MSESSVPLPWADLKAYRAAQREVNPIPAPEAVPADLAGRPQWLMWRYEPGETPEKKPRKMPYYANGKKRWFGKGKEQGCPEDRAALVDFAAASAAAKKRGFDGVGFAFLPDDGLVGIDLDGMIDPETGDISERCTSIIEACASYTEYSPSGKGVHIIGRGECETFKSNAVGVEVFTGRQYFTFTGRPWPGAPADVCEIEPQVLRRLRATVDAAKGKPKTGSAPAIAPSAPRAAGQERSLAETVALVEEALTHLAADEYDEWILFGHICKADLGTAGYMVWDAWSSRSPKYAGPEDTAKRWGGFKEAKADVGAIFKRAESSGWKAPWAKARERKARRTPPAPASVPPVAGDAPVDPAPSPAEPISTPPEACAGEWPEPPPDDDWESRLLHTEKGQLRECIANVHDILLHSSRWDGVIGYDLFAQRTVKLRPPPYVNGEVGPWEDNDDTQTAMWLTRTWSFAPDPVVVGKAVEALARAAAFHPVQQYLDALPAWDGESRVDAWLTRFCGVEASEYARLVGRFFLIGMIARVMRPGAKMDYCLVLEGEQGKRKSTVARILGGEWYGDTDLNLENKDSMAALQGKWVYEFAEMGSVTRAESSKQKSFLSRQWDEFRPTYGKRMIRLPRQCVFIGTTNEDEWNKDPTGGRRFWAVRCVGEIDVEGLAEAREQLFAEALALFNQDERYWPSKEEQDALFSPQQAQREIQESLIDALHDWVYAQVCDFSLAEAALNGLDLDASKLTRDLQTRIGNALRKLGCIKIEKRNGMTRFWYRPPQLIKPVQSAPIQASRPAGTVPAMSPVRPGSAPQEARRAPF